LSESKDPSGRDAIFCVSAYHGYISVRVSTHHGYISVRVSTHHGYISVRISVTLETLEILGMTRSSGYRAPQPERGNQDLLQLRECARKVIIDNNMIIVPGFR